MADGENCKDRRQQERAVSSPRVVVVMLRRPRLRDSKERRDDPFWEFGSFGCTGCHSRNLLNPKRSGQLDGVQFAFVQGGVEGLRLVHVTPPITTTLLGAVCEVKWAPAKMPLTYATAPIVIDNMGRSDVPLLAAAVTNVRRSTPVARFSSAFRSRRLPLAGEVGAQVVAIYKRYRAKAKVARRYEEAMPYPPPKIEWDRAARYNALKARRLTDLDNQAKYCASIKRRRSTSA